MNTATTTCLYLVDISFFGYPTGQSARLTFDTSDNQIYLYDDTTYVGNVPANTPLVPSRSVCTTQDASLGSLNFGIAIIVTLFFLFVIAFFYNQITAKKAWK